MRTYSEICQAAIVGAQRMLRAARDLRAAAEGPLSVSALEGFYRIVWDTYNGAPDFRAMDPAQRQAVMEGLYPNCPEDVTATYGAVLAAGQAVADWIDAAIPRDAEGWLLTDKLDHETGAWTRRSYTAAEMAGLRDALDDLIEALEPLE